MAKAAIIHSVRISADYGGSVSTSAQICAINYIANYGVRPAVVNMSVGGHPSAFSVRDAINTVTAANIEFVKSAGNDAVEAFEDRGNRGNNELVVGATDPTNDTYASFSDYGPTVSLWAPGNNVLVADKFNPGYGKIASGTSSSAPYVTGFVALLLQKYPTWDVPAIFSQTVNNSTKNVIAGLPTRSYNRLLYSIVP